MKTRLTTLLLLCLTAVVTASAKEVPQLVNVMSHESMLLNGKWHYIVA